MRLSRENAGVSQRYIEVVTGVAHSEISKVEKGSQDCRLDSLVRFCAALGVSTGYVLDQVVAANPLYYAARIKHDPRFQDLVSDHPGMAAMLTFNLAVIAAFAAHLIRCHRPTERAETIDYPDEGLRLVFVKYAKQVEGLSGPADKLRLLEAWKERPVDTLSRFGFLEMNLVLKVLAALTSGNVGGKSELRDAVLDAMKIRRDIPVWMPFVPKALFDTGADNQAENNLTNVSESVNELGVKPKLPTLLDRLKKATSQRGKKSELAKFLDVSLVQVSQWLSGDREPGGETTLRMLHWVGQQERQK